MRNQQEQHYIFERDSEGRYYFVSSKPVEDLDPALSMRFDSQGRLLDKHYNGEFFLDNYESLPIIISMRKKVLETSMVHIKI